MIHGREVYLREQGEHTGGSSLHWSRALEERYLSKGHWGWLGGGRGGKEGSGQRGRCGKRPEANGGKNLVLFPAQALLPSLGPWGPPFSLGGGLMHVKTFRALTSLSVQ